MRLGTWGLRRTIQLDRGDLGTRVDRVLLRHLKDVPGLSRNKIQKLIDAGAVCINGAPAARVSWRIAAGDALTIDLPEAKPRQRPKAEQLPIEVVYEDEDLLVVNKPAGQVAHPAFKNPSSTLLNALLAYANGNWTPALVSRLDKETSGLVLVAKDRATQAALQRAMNRNDVEKDYLAVVRGKPSPAKGTIDLALDRDPWDRRRVMVRDRGGQQSITRYEKLETSREGQFSIVRCRLITGRTHQIRVHLAAKGWPIVGDATYGTRDPRIGRQALHAWRLTFTHPRTHRQIRVEAAVPPDLSSLISPRSLSS